jgi:hypothetical protein
VASFGALFIANSAMGRNVSQSEWSKLTYDLSTCSKTWLALSVCPSDWGWYAEE